MRRPYADELLGAWIVAGVLFCALVTICAVLYALRAPIPGPADDAAWKASVAALHAQRTR